MDRLFFWAAVTGFCSWGFIIFLVGFIVVNSFRDWKADKERDRAIQDRIDRGMF